MRISHFQVLPIIRKDVLTCFRILQRRKSVMNLPSLLTFHSWRPRLELLLLLVLLLAVFGPICRKCPHRPEPFNLNEPIIWVGGYARSGTTLARVMLEAHPDVVCGEESLVIPPVIAIHNTKWKLHSKRLLQAGISEKLINEALGQWMMSIISRFDSPRLCSKDPMSLAFMTRILSIFPNSKFLLMLRDVRGCSHSMEFRHVIFGTNDVHNHTETMIDWNRKIAVMYRECAKVGPKHCMAVHYEKLILNTEQVIRQIVDFFGLEWHDQILHFDKLVRSGHIRTSSREPSTSQVSRAINVSAITAWTKHRWPVGLDVGQIAPMMRLLGYDTNAIPPDYTKLPLRMIPRSENVLADLIQKFS